MIETKEKNIEGDVYSVTQFPARMALRMKAKLIRLFGPVMTQVGILLLTKQDDEQQKKDLIKAVELLSCHINENEFEAIAVELLSFTRKNNAELKPALIDMEFAGNMAALYQVLWFVIEVNYSNFFQMIGIGNQLPVQEIPSNVMKKTFTRACA